MKKKTDAIHFLFSPLALLPFIVFFIKFPLSPLRDWDYFNSQGLLIGHDLKSFKLPLFDWATCGGQDLWANPQNWIFSPLSLLNLLFAPYLANLFSLIVCAVLGMAGMYFLCWQVVNKTDRVLISMLFILSSFFNLHFAEGHITYRTFYLLPWILYFCLNLKSPKQLWWLIAILALMFLDGGIYPFYFSLILIFLNLKWSSFYSVVKQNKENVSLMILGGVMLIGCKLLPVLFIHGGRKPEFESISYSLGNIITALFNIKQTNYSGMSGQLFHFHEYGLYIGAAISILFLRSLSSYKEDKKTLFQVFFFFWISFGIGGIFNPWTIIKLIPLVNHMHIQSRLLILAYLMLLFFMSKSLGRSRSRLLLIVACAELLACAFYTNIKSFTESRNSTSIRVESPTDAVSLYQVYIKKPDVYSSKQLSYSCYEPAQQQNLKKDLRLFLGTDSSDLSAIFGERNIKITSKISDNKPFVLNYNWNGGWDCEGCDAINNDGLVEVRPEAHRNFFVLTYNPIYWSFCIVLYVLGLAVLAYAGIRRRDGI